jgi:hypothetical protein
MQKKHLAKAVISLFFTFARDVESWRLFFKMFRDEWKTARGEALYPAHTLSVYVSKLDWWQENFDGIWQWMEQKATKNTQKRFKRLSTVLERG